MKNKDNRTEFMNSVYTRVSDTLKEEGIDPGWAPIVASQMMIESSWGQSPMSRIHNYFGMKATNGQQGDYFNTHEGFGSSTTHIKDKFLSFKDMDEGVRAGVRRLRDSFNAFEGTPSPEQYIANINRNPKRVYFTGDPRDYLRNLRAISAGDRMKYAKDHYAEIQLQRDTDKLNRAVQSRQPLAVDALTVANPQAQKVTRTIPQPVMIPRQNQYVAVDYDRDARPREDALSALRSLDQYNKLMSLLDWNSQPQSQFAPTGVSLAYSSGGQMKKRRWDDLSMKERADLMGIAVRSGITSLDTIRDTYNQYAEGGDKKPVTTGGAGYIPSTNILQGVSDAVSTGAQRLRDRMYRTVRPTGYTLDQVENFIRGRDRHHEDINTEALYGKYLGQDSVVGTVPFRPFFNPNTLPGKKVGGDRWVKKVAVDDYVVPSKTKEGAYELAYPELSQFPTEVVSKPTQLHNHSLGTYTIRPRADSLGVYNEYEDSWDVNPFRGVSSSDGSFFNIGPSLGLDRFEDIVPWGMPFDIHGRIPATKSHGGSIHIDPSKKGTFTAAASKHGKSVQAFASQVLAHPENYSPAMRKKANFARNAAKFKHSLGGPLVERAMTFIESDKDKHPRLSLGW